MTSNSKMTKTLDQILAQPTPTLRQELEKWKNEAVKEAIIKKGVRNDK